MYINFTVNITNFTFSITLGHHPNDDSVDHDDEPLPPPAPPPKVSPPKSSMSPSPLSENHGGGLGSVDDDRGLLSQQAQPTSLSHEQFRAALQMVVSAGDPRYSLIQSFIKQQKGCIIINNGLLFFIKLKES